MTQTDHLLALYQRLAEAALTAAATNRAQERWIVLLSNYANAASRLFARALIGWRSGVFDPSADLTAAVDAAEEGLSIVPLVDLPAARQELRPVPGVYSALLLGRASPIVDYVVEHWVDPSPRTIASRDAAVEASLVSALTGGPVGHGPALAAEFRQVKRTALFGETFLAYYELAAVPADDHPAAWELTRRLIGLFAKRRRNGYFTGGPVEEGGGDNNDLVIDYRIAAIWHTRGWDPSGLTPNERLHAIRPRAWAEHNAEHQ